jgi:hypothetical protein
MQPEYPLARAMPETSEFVAVFTCQLAENWFIKAVAGGKNTSDLRQSNKKKTKKTVDIIAIGTACWEGLAANIATIHTIQPKLITTKGTKRPKLKPTHGTKQP